jgi:hypothetical protein
MQQDDKIKYYSLSGYGIILSVPIIFSLTCETVNISYPSGFGVRRIWPLQGSCLFVGQNSRATRGHTLVTEPELT